MVAAVLSNAAPSGTEQWGCDLLACRVLEEASSQIVGSCRALGAELEGVCGKAMQRLPGPLAVGDESDGLSAFDCADACHVFIAAFATLSTAIVAVAGDLEITVSQPLRKSIALLTEESTGRAKHLQQVRSRFAELQERYRKTRQKTMEAKGKLEVQSSAGEKRWSWGRSSISESQRAASDQHAAMCDLARCEEELVESEASLRKLEDDSRERLRQLDREKKAMLRGALVRGACSLRRLLPVTDKVPLPEEWQGVMPSTDTAGRTPQAEAQADAAALGAVVGCPVVLGDASCVTSIKTSSNNPESNTRNNDISIETSINDTHSISAPTIDSRCSGNTDLVSMAHESSAASGSVMDACHSRGPEKLGPENLGLLELLEPALQDETEVTAVFTPVDGSRASRYLQTAGDGFGRQSSCGLSDDEQEVVDVEEASLTARAAGWSPGASSSRSGAGSSQVPKKRSLVFQSSNEFLIGQASRCSDSPFREGAGDAFIGSGTRLFPPPPSQKEATGPSAEAPPPPLAKFAEKKTSAAESEEGSDFENPTTEQKHALALLDEPKVALQFSPLVAEFPQRCFERYVKRVAERLAAVGETSWEKLQLRSADQPLGGVVGKLEMFWVHRPSTKPTAEEAEGLVCFQFVQGFAANHVRILHLSVTSGEEVPGGDPSWRDVLPSAILEARRLIFGTLPVDSLRAVVLAGEDDAGRIYVDRDVEEAYQQCRFRWFQLTQSLRRSRGLSRRRKFKPSSRFLVLHAPRMETDPVAPRSNIGTRPALLLRSGAASSKEESSAAVLAAALDGSADEDTDKIGFTAW
ncbi:unnamed protein product [Polarella glacialis]|uniref:Uncharacterized protein n=1 Tax=Polarella glacialis TaxID=89957 RepID=A0A813DCM7_POLGL|nr:unnamed protein product [Polarella glacialis]